MNIKRYRYTWTLRRKIIWGRRPKKERRRIKAMVTFLCIIGIIALLYQYIEKVFLPTVIAISEYRIRTISTDVINQAVDDTLYEMEVNSESLVTYYYDGEGNFQSFGVNSVLINKISSEIIYNINEQMENYNEEVLTIPMGKLLGNSIFANFGPPIHVKIQPYGTAATNYHSSFTATGINQINHRIWIKVDLIMQVIIPFDSTRVTVSQDITMIDRVINGQIPEQYINVPEEEFLNVVN